MINMRRLATDPPRLDHHIQGLLPSWSSWQPATTVNGHCFVGCVCRDLLHLVRQKATSRPWPESTETGLEVTWGGPDR